MWPALILVSADVKEKTSHLERERQFMVLSYGKRRHIFLAEVYRYLGVSYYHHRPTFFFRPKVEAAGLHGFVFLQALPS